MTNPTAKIVYNPAQGDPQTTVWMGQTFIAGEEVETRDIALIEKARANKHFIVDGVDMRAQEAEAAEKKGYDEARATLVSIDEKREQLERQQEGEIEKLEGEHQAARDAFENASEPSIRASLAVIEAYENAHPKTDDGNGVDPAAQGNSLGAPVAATAGGSGGTAGGAGGGGGAGGATYAGGTTSSDVGLTEQTPAAESDPPTQEKSEA